MVGCSDDTSDRGAPVPLATGSIELSWTVARAQEAGSCERFGADRLQAALGAEGYVVQQLTAPCADFSASMKQYVGDYALSMTLVDENGYRVTERVLSIRFVLREDENELIEFDFPESSFLHAADGGGGAGGSSDGGAPAGGAGLEVQESGAGGVAASESGDE